MDIDQGMLEDLIEQGWPDWRVIDSVGAWVEVVMGGALDKDDND